MSERFFSWNILSVLSRKEKKKETEFNQECNNFLIQLLSLNFIQRLNLNSRGKDLIFAQVSLLSKHTERITELQFIQFVTYGSTRKYIFQLNTEKKKHLL